MIKICIPVSFNRLYWSYVKHGVISEFRDLFGEISGCDVVQETIPGGNGLFGDVNKPVHYRRALGYSCCTSHTYRLYLRVVYLSQVYAHLVECRKTWQTTLFVVIFWQYSAFLE